MEINYAPPKSLQRFLFSEKFIAMAVGPVGSTKTAAGIMKIAYHAQRMAPCLDGIRRSRAIWVRRSRQMLFDTSIKDFLTWFPDGQYGTFMKSNSSYLMRFADVECEVLFRPMEDESDINRLLSLQGSFAIFDEFREISPRVFEAMQGRLGRFPDKRMVPPRKEWGLDSRGNPIGGCVTDDGKPNKHLWGMTNPPDADTEWEKLLMLPPDNMHVTFQPSGLSPEADWLQFLPDGYYEDLAKGKSEDYVDVYIHSKFGRSLSGQPVFKAFNREVHVSKEPLVPIVGSQLVIGIDAGLTPAAVLGQQSYDGRLVIHDSLASENMGALRFIREKLKPLLTRKYSGFSTCVVIDPAAFQRAQTDERSVADIFKQEGFAIRRAHTNSIAARISAVDKFLTRTVDGKPGLLVNCEGNPDLIRALGGGYRYKIKKTGEAEDKPDKNESSHISDACFEAGTLVSTDRGDINIEDITPGDKVITRNGPRLVLDACCTGIREVQRYYFSDGTTLVATPNHPVFTINRGFIPIDGLTYTDVLLTRYQLEDEECHTSPFTKFKSLTALGSTRNRAAITNATTTESTMGTPYIASFGSIVMVKFLRGFTCITRTATVRIARLKTLNWFQPQITRNTTCARDSKKTPSGTNPDSQKPVNAQKSGTLQTKVELGTASTLYGWLKIVNQKLGHVLNAAKSTLGLKDKHNGASVPHPVKPAPEFSAESMMKPESAQSAGQASGSIDTKRQKPAPRLVGKSQFLSPRPVFNLSVEADNEYYANGILVHNCQYLCLHIDGGTIFGHQMPVRRDIITEPYVWC